MSRRALAAALLAAPALACAACSSGSAAVKAHGGPAASCADVVTIAGTRYIGGREGATPVPHTGSALDAVRPPCSDGDEPSRPVVVHTIPGVRVEDAVAGPLGYEVLIAERWWQQPWSALPVALQPYVRR